MYKPDRVQYTCSPNTSGRRRQVDPEVLSGKLLQYNHWALGSMKYPTSKNKVSRSRERLSTSTCGPHACTHTNICMYTLYTLILCIIHMCTFKKIYNAAQRFSSLCAHENHMESIANSDGQKPSRQDLWMNVSKSSIMPLILLTEMTTTSHQSLSSILLPLLCQAEGTWRNPLLNEIYIIQCLHLQELSQQPANGWLMHSRSLLILGFWWTNIQDSETFGNYVGVYFGACRWSVPCCVLPWPFLCATASFCLLLIL